MTIEDTLTLGGHFYFSGTLKQSALAIMNFHSEGYPFEEEDHPPAALFRVVEKLHADQQFNDRMDAFDFCLALGN